MVKELMVPLADYATVSEDATLREALLTMEEAQKRVEAGSEKHRAILDRLFERRGVCRFDRASKAQKRQRIGGIDPFL